MRTALPASTPPPRSSGSHWLSANLLAVITGLALLATACAPTPTRTYEIRQRAFAYDPTKLVADYREEFRYIAARRHAAANGPVASPPPPDSDTSHAQAHLPDNLTGLAFSGGGIRSATFHLGLLEALQDMRKLTEMDYLSTVSGGSYVAGWLLAHAGEEQDDEYGYDIRTHDLDRLMDPRGDFVTHLRHHAGFLREDGFWEGPALVWSYLWRLPIYYVWDLGLHIKTAPNFANFIHLFTPYQRRVEATYLRGQREIPLVQTNTASAMPPYLIVNGNLVNRGRPRGYPSRNNRPYRDNYNFEFTRDFTGSDGLGYVQTAGFGLPVVDVLDQDGKSAESESDPHRVIVEDLAKGTCGNGVASRFRPEYCVRLSEAMTASGAGLDLDSLVEEWYQDDIVRFTLGVLSAPFNLNNEFETWNYARRYNSVLGTMWDYLLMMTIQRVWPDTKSRWIEVTDGSFFDNLGVYSLLRRNVAHVIVGDATLDTRWQYDYLHKLKARLGQYFNGPSVEKPAEWCGEIPEKGEIVWYRRFWIRRPNDGSTTVIHYLKPYAYNIDLFANNPSLTAPGRIYLSARPEQERDRAQDPLASPPTNPTHLDLGRLLPLTADARARQALALGVNKVRKFVDSPKSNDFPQTGTIFQWFDLEEFEAYRHLGYVMGSAYLAKVRFTESDLAPGERCLPLSEG